MNKFALTAILIFFSARFLFSQNGANYELREIRIENSSFFSASQLKGAIYSKQTPHWIWKFLNSVSTDIGAEPLFFDRYEMESDLRIMKNLYRENGFFDAEISYKYFLDTNSKTADLSYRVNEGDPYLIRNLRLNSLNASADLAYAGMFREVTIHTNKRFSSDLIRENEDRMNEYLLNNGYMFSKIVKPIRIEMDTSEKRVDIHIDVIIGERYLINEIRVEKTGPGRDFVDNDLIAKLGGIKEGDYYNREKIRQAQTRLMRTKLFNSVFVNASTIDTNGNKVPLSIEGDIGLMNEFSPEVILNNQENAFNAGLGLNFSRKNFLGGARFFSAKTSFVMQDIFNVDYYRITKSVALTDTILQGYFDARISLEQPQMFSPYIFGSIEGYMNLNKRSEYNAATYGGKYILNFELPSYTFFNALSAYYNFETSKYVYRREFLTNAIMALFTRSNTMFDSVAINDAYRDAEARTLEDVSSYLGFETTANQTNDILFPSRGFSLYFMAEEGNFIPYLIGKIFNSEVKYPQFYKIVAASNFYINAYKSRTSLVAVKIKTGYIQSYSGEDIAISLNRRFFCGGSNSVRGWQARELAARKNGSAQFTAFTNQDLLAILNNAASIGGTMLFEGSIESRNRIVGDFGSAFFIDYGNVWDGYKKFQFNQVAVAVGFGLRYYSPVGPLRLDFGFKFHDPNKPGSFFKTSPFNDMQFHFGIGEAF